MDFEKDITPEDRFLHNIFAHMMKITNFDRESKLESNHSCEMSVRNSDMRYIPIEAIPALPLGDRDNLVLIGHPSSFGNSYRLKNLRVIPDREVRPGISLTLYLGGNIVSVIRAWDGRPLGYFVDTCHSGNLQERVEAFSAATDDKRRAYIQETLLLLARTNAADLRHALESMRFDDEGGKSRNAFEAVAGAIIRSSISIQPASGIMGAAAAIVLPSDKPKSSPEKKAHASLARDSGKFNKENNEALQQALCNINPNDAVRLIRLAMQNPKVAKNMLNFESWPEAARYHLHVVPREPGNKDFGSNCRYCLYYSKGKGPRIPIKFLHTPSYCIYLMYVIDRAKRGDKAGPLVFWRNKDEFIKLYMAIYGITYKEGLEKYEKAAYRRDENNKLLRGGRYNDYMSDIDTRIVEKFGDYDSFLLKPGFKGFISIRPENIEIDETLKVFNFQ